MNQEFRYKSSQPRNFILFFSQQLILTLQYIQTLHLVDSLLQTCFVSKIWHTTVNLNTVNLTIFTAFSGIIHDISCILGYGNYPEGYPSGYSGYGYGGQASTTPVSTPVATQPAPITG